MLALANSGRLNVASLAASDCFAAGLCPARLQVGRPERVVGRGFFRLGGPPQPRNLNNPGGWRHSPAALLLAAESVDARHRAERVCDSLSLADVRRDRRGAGVPVGAATDHKPHAKQADRSLGRHTGGAAVGDQSFPCLVVAGNPHVQPGDDVGGCFVARPVDGAPHADDALVGQPSC